MNEQVATRPTQAVAHSLKDLLHRPEYESAFRRVLGERAPQFISSIISVGRTMQDVEPRSIIGSAMTAAALDLPIDKNLGFAWVVPYKKGGQKLAQFQMGYRGLVQLAFRSGQYARMNARAINAEVFGGWDDCGDPIFRWDNLDETQPVAGYAFIFKLTNGFTKSCYWTKKRVETHAGRYSQSFRGGYDSPWKTHFDEMALKTVISNELRKWGILSVEMRTALQADQAVVADAGAEPEFVDNTSVMEPVKPIFDSPAPALPEPAPQPQAQPEQPAGEPVKRMGRPAGSKNKPKEPTPAPAPTPMPEPQPESQPEPQATKSDDLPFDDPPRVVAEPVQPKPANGLHHNYVKAINGLCSLSKVEPAQVVAFIHGMGLADDSLLTLEEIGEMMPSALQHVHDKWGVVLKAIREQGKE